MSPTRFVRPASIRVALAIALVIGPLAFAGELRLPLPKKSKPTEVQKLNQEGVAAVRKHRYDEARKLFYHAYLIDPNDPFTLNNLGYIAELDGEIDRAHSFYQLAAQNSTDATIAVASDDQFLGKPVSKVAGNAGDRNIQVNRLNAEALSLLLKDRAPEADTILLHAYQLDPRNPFTLNNLGYAKEQEGELELAIRYYTMASAIDSREPIALAANRSWRGRPINEVAAENARNAQRALRREENNPDSKVARLNMQGVAAINRNDRALARKYFKQAYDIDATNAFTLNNMGYVAELDGDRETADYYYTKARAASRSGNRVALATRRDLEGKPLGYVANTNDSAINTAITAEVEAKRRQGAPAVLRTRNNAFVAEPPAPPAIDPGQPYNIHAEYVPEPEPAPANPPAMARPSTSNPAWTVHRPPTSGGGAPAMSQPMPTSPTQPVTTTSPNQPYPATRPSDPLPGDTAPPNFAQPMPRTNAAPASTQLAPGATTAPTNSQPAANPGDVLPPLPDNQQPPQARGSGTQSAPSQPQPLNRTVPQTRPQQQNQGPTVQPGDILPPLPDDQQPKEVQQQPR